LEREEDLAGVRLVEPDAVIPDIVDGLAPLLLGADSICASGSLEVNFSALPSRFSSATVSRR
jgi:hypothetical protein